MRSDGYLAPSVLPGEFNNSIVLLGGSYRLYWKLLDIQDQATTSSTSAVSIVIAVEADALGWVGFGLGDSMANADMIIGSVTNSSVSVKDCYSTDTVIPTEGDFFQHYI